MQALEKLAGSGRLIREATSVEEISGFLMRAEQQLADARSASLSVASRFSPAYDAAHAFALIALRYMDMHAHQGCRPGSASGHVSGLLRGPFESRPQSAVAKTRQMSVTIH